MRQNKFDILMKQVIDDKNTNVALWFNSPESILGSLEQSTPNGRNGILCHGIKPEYRLQSYLTDKIDEVGPFIAAVMFDIGAFKQYPDAMKTAMRHARSKNIIVIADIEHTNALDTMLKAAIDGTLPADIVAMPRYSYRSPIDPRVFTNDICAYIKPITQDLGSQKSHFLDPDLVQEIANEVRDNGEGRVGMMIGVEQKRAMQIARDTDPHMLLIVPGIEKDSSLASVPLAGIHALFPMPSNCLDEKTTPLWQMQINDMLNAALVRQHDALVGGIK